MVGTQPADEYLGPVGDGGQGRVSLLRVSVDFDRAVELLHDGWVVHGLDDPEGAEPYVLCIEKQPFPPEQGIRPQERNLAIDRARRAWGRISREYNLLEHAAGCGTPKTLETRVGDPSDAAPWENSILIEYIDAPTLWTLAEQGCRPQGDDLVDLAWGLFDILGGADGTSGLHGRDIAHRDLMADQVLIPSRNGARDWAHPVIIDLGYAYHPAPRFALQGPDRRPRPSSEPGIKPGYLPPERSPGYAQPEDSSLLKPDGDPETESTRRRHLQLYQAGDLWSWAMTIGYVSTGTNIYDNRPADDGHIEYSTAWRSILDGESVLPPLLDEVHESLRSAMAVALDRVPDRRDRTEIADKLPPPTTVRALEEQLAAATAPLESQVASLKKRVADSSNELREALNRVDQVTKDADDAGRRAAEATADSERAKHEAAALRAQAEEHTAALAAARRRVAKARRDRDGLKADLARAREDRRPRAILWRLALLLGVLLVVAALLRDHAQGPRDQAVPGFRDAIVVGNNPTGVAASDDSVWVTNVGDGTITRIDPARNKVEETIELGGNPGGVAIASAVWVTNGEDGTVTRIDPRPDPDRSSDGSPSPVVPSTEASSERTAFVTETVDLGSPTDAITANNESVWVTLGGVARVARIDPATNEVTATIDVGSGPFGVAIADRAVWVTNAGDGTVTRIDPDTNRVTATISVGHDPYGVAGDNEAVWVANAGSGTVTRIDPDTNKVTGTVTVGSYPLRLAVSDDAVWVTDKEDGTVSRIDPATMEVTGAFYVGAGPDGVALTNDSVWVASYESNTVIGMNTGG